MFPRTLLAALALLALVAPASARAGVEPLPPPAAMSPADGAAVPAGGFGLTIYAAPTFVPGGTFDIEVATSPVPDADGTLPDAARVDRLVAGARADLTGVWSVRPTAAWAETPGTYWWQGYAASGATVHATPVRRLIVGPPRPPGEADGDPAGPGAPGGAAAPGPAAYLDVERLTRASALRAVGATVRKRTRVRPHGLAARCAFPTPFDARCRVAWRDASFRYRGRMFVWAGATGAAGASFTGTRAIRGCRRGRCARAVRWSPS